MRTRAQLTSKIKSQRPDVSPLRTFYPKISIHSIESRNVEIGNNDLNWRNFYVLTFPGRFISPLAIHLFGAKNWWLLPLLTQEFFCLLFQQFKRKMRYWKISFRRGLQIIAMVCLFKSKGSGVFFYCFLKIVNAFCAFTRPLPNLSL